MECPQFDNFGLSTYENSLFHEIFSDRIYNEVINNKNKNINKSKFKNRIINDSKLKDLSFSTKDNYFNKSLSIMKKYGLDEKNINGEKVITYNHKKPLVNIFYEQLMKETCELGYPSINASYILNKNKVHKLLLMDHLDVNDSLYNLMTDNYLSFGQLTGMTINWDNAHFKSHFNFPLDTNIHNYKKIN